jgi:phage shock protein E
MKAHLSLTLAAILLCSVAVAQEARFSSASHVDVNGAEKLIKDNGVAILDIRTADEFKEGHIAGAVNIDFMESDFEKKASELDKSKPYLVHCASGCRGVSCIEILRKLGFKQLYHLDGGMIAWQESGKSVVH